MSEVDVVAEMLRATMFPYLRKGLSEEENVMALKLRKTSISGT
jgi:hypothetical protein